MNPMKWKTRNLAYVGIGLFAFYFLFNYKCTHHLLYKSPLINSNAKHVWEFVADFSNMMKLNPTIEEFNIIDDSGNYDQWKYSVQYVEHFIHFPIIRNHAHGHFLVKPKAKNYVIESEHQTCFLFGFNCLNSHSEFIFEQKEQDTNCIQKIQYECPLVFSIFTNLCHREVMYQRQEIMKNLQTHFATVNVKKEQIT